MSHFSVRKLSLWGLILACSSCSLDHGRSVATLEYLSVEELRNTGIYQIYFHSSEPVLELFKSRIGEGLVCSLDDDLDFAQAHHIKLSGFGLVELVKDKEQSSYRANMIFTDSEEGKGRESYLEGDTLKPLLLKRDYISCVFRVHTTRYKTYFSTVMHVPTADLLKAINKK
ncbi:MULTISPECIES: hypothetical protein [Pseudomonas]|uniref:hypothetical protein n=1 Tax=Pseudomonas TaxID=286 RepID=UPI001F3EA82F|nr:MULTISPECIES: hypothetical protein [Pseudomonas]